MVEDGKTANYLKYGIGEIVLVVIGILLALQINNWNEKQKNEEKILTILEDIQKDLSEDIVSANLVFDKYVRNDSLKKIFLTDKLTFRDHYFIYYYANLIIHKNGYLNLIQNSNSIPKKYAGIFKDLNNLYINIAQDIPVFNERIRTTVYNGVDYLAKNKDWFIDWNSGNENPAIEQFYLSDMNYKNQLVSYMNDLLNLCSDANTYKVNAIDMYQKIDTLLGNKTPVPKHVTYHLADSTLLKQLAGHYKWQDGLTDEKEQTMVLKVKDGGLFYGYAIDKESDYTELYWYKDKTFFLDRMVLDFNMEQGNTTLTFKLHRGFQKWLKQ